jgi:threonine synthase
MAQVVYYVTTVGRLGRCGFSVPSGNFGNIFAGWVAEQMGLPVGQLVIAANSNDILARWVADGAMVAEPVVPTLSPAMDIQVSSNHERLLYELTGRDGAATADLLTRFRGVGSVEAPRTDRFDAATVTDAETIDTIRAVHDETGVLIDPHTAVGVAAARRCRRPTDEPMVCVATAHPAKFPDAVEQATGLRPPLPSRLADLLERDERFEVLGADLADVQRHVEACISG